MNNSSIPILSESSPSQAGPAWLPALDTPVGFSKGSVPSKFGDDYWDLTALAGSAASWIKWLDFPRLERLGIEAESVRQLKGLLYMLLHEQGAPLPSASTLLGKFYALRTYAAFASRQGKSLFEAIGDVNLNVAFIQERPSSAVELYSVLTKLEQSVDAFPVQLPLKELHAHISRADQILRANEKQTAVIPTRVYSYVLSQIERELRIAEEILPHLLNYLTGAIAASRGGYAPPNEELRAYAQHLGQQETAPRLSDFAGWISNVYVVCQVAIAAYSGMRRNEIATLPLQALTTFEHGGTVHTCVRGFTTKFNNGVAQEVTWLTNSTGARALRCAIELASHLHRLNGSDATSGDSLLLFPRHGFGSYGVYNGQALQQADIPRDKLFARLSPLIEPEDLDELEQVDVDRHWTAEPNFACGKPWPLTMHQFRRSLAIYAHRSGLVTLPSLKSQLQHLTEEMSLYYAKGSEYANAVVYDKEHFAADWNAARASSEYLGYALNVLMSDERLFGGGAAWASSPAVRSSPVSVYSRTHAMRMFERGEIAYRETPVGGCTNTSSCDVSPFNPLPLDCLDGNCPNLVVSPKKLQRVVESQEMLVGRLASSSQDTVEYRMEKRGLEILKRVAARMEESNE